MPKTKKSSSKGSAKPAAPKTKTGKPINPHICSTPRCKGEPTLTHLGKPLCAKCWDRHCQDEPAAPVAAETATVAVGAHDGATVAPEANGPDVAATNAGGSEKKPRGKKPPDEPKPKRVSALDAAAAVLEKAGTAMTTQEMVVAMDEQGLWSSPAGKTPHATLYSAILREIGTKGADARFRKLERGKFAIAAA